VNAIEIVSYSLIILIGLRLLWVKGRAFLALLRTLHRPAPLSAAATPQPHDHPHHHHHGHDHAHHAHGEAHHHAHPHEDASAWGHAHAPEPEELAGPGGWKRGLSAIVAVGLRPCSGAILVLVFALAQGLFWTGVISTFVMAVGTAITVAAIASLAVAARAWAKHIAEARSGYGMLAMRAIEVGAAVVIIAFGTLLLTGYMGTERMVGILLATCCGPAPEAISANPVVAIHPRPTMTAEHLSTRCCVVGGGPCGLMLGFLLARAGVDVVVLEKHADFLRDFRGDTVHPSTLDVMAELGLLDDFLKLPHQKALNIGA